MGGVRAGDRSDIAQDTPWQGLGRIDSDTVFDPGDSPEEPRATLDTNDNGLIMWHSNSVNDAKTAFSLIRAGRPQTATFLSKEETDSFLYATTLAPGAPVAGFELPVTGTALFRFKLGVPRTPRTASPGMAPTSLGSAAELVGDREGSLLVLLEQGQNPEHLVAVLGDFAQPVLKLHASPRKPKAKQTVTLVSGATDMFAALTTAEVTWTLPKGVKALAGTHGLQIRVRLSRARRYAIKVTATDPGGNKTAGKLVVKVAASAMPAARAQRSLMSLVAGGLNFPGRPLRKTTLPCVSRSATGPRSHPDGRTPDALRAREARCTRRI